MSTAWISPVTDRAQSDIDGKTSKAYLNTADLNRIEGNIAHLSEFLNSKGYKIPLFPPVVWTKKGIPTTEDIQRICGRVKAITEAYYEPKKYMDISGLYEKRLDFNDVNYVEENLREIKELLNRGIHYNTWGDLAPYTHGDLSAYTHEKLLKGFGYPDFL
jgi:hypothetical protein